MEKAVVLKRLDADIELVIGKMKEAKALLVKLKKGGENAGEEYNWADQLHEIATDYNIGSRTDRAGLVGLICDLDNKMAEERINSLPIICRDVLDEMEDVKRQGVVTRVVK